MGGHGGPLGHKSNGKGSPGHEGGEIFTRIIRELTIVARCEGDRDANLGCVGPSPRHQEANMPGDTMKKLSGGVW